MSSVEGRSLGVLKEPADLTTYLVEANQGDKAWKEDPGWVGEARVGLVPLEDFCPPAGVYSTKT